MPDQPESPSTGNASAAAPARSRAPEEGLLFRAAAGLAFASALSVLFSIAVSQILLGMAIVALLLSGAPIRIPRIGIPLGVFLGGTLISLAFSADPASGMPQVRKFFVFAILPVAFSTLRNTVILRRLFLCWAAAGALVSVRGLVQFLTKMEQARAAGQDFYTYYVGERITGFMSHWMTFSGQQVFVLLMLAAWIFFAPKNMRKAFWFWALCAVILGVGLVLGFTRSIWLATGASGAFLVWRRRPAAVLAVPVIAALVILAAPSSVKTRVVSIFRAKKELDSNQHRIVCWRTGFEMIRKHPLLGLGPEQVKAQFLSYVPADIPRPLPTGWYGHLHNIYIHYAAERGVPVMLALLWMVGLMLWDFLRKLRTLSPGPSDSRFLLNGAVAVIIATLVAGFFELNLGDSEVLTMFLTVAAAGYVAVEA